MSQLCGIFSPPYFFFFNTTNRSISNAPTTCTPHLKGWGKISIVLQLPPTSNSYALLQHPPIHLLGIHQSVVLNCARVPSMRIDSSLDSVFIKRYRTKKIDRWWLLWGNFSPHFLPKPPTSSSSSQSSSSYSLFLKYRYVYGTYTCVQLTMCNLLLPSAVASAREEHHNTTTYNLTVCICVWMCTWVGVYFFPYPRLSDEVLHNFMHNSGEGASPPSFREAAPGVFGAWGEIQVTIRPLPKKKRELLCNFQPEVPTPVCVCCFAPEAMPGFEINNVEKNNIISFVDRWSVVLYPKMCHERVAKSRNSLVVQFCEINMNRSEELWNRK